MSVKLLVSKHGKIRYKVDPQTGCWIWQLGRCGNYGEYGTMRDGKGRRITAHRYFFRELVTTPPNDSHVHHLCNNTLCVNPRHLEMLDDGAHVTSHNMGRRGSHCSQGHVYDRFYKCGQRCSVCDRLAYEERQVTR